MSHADLAFAAGLQAAATLVERLADTAVAEGRDVQALVLYTAALEILARAADGDGAAASTQPWRAY